MPGETFYPNQHKALPGVYVRIINVGPAALPATRQGTIACVLRSSWGPLAEPTDVTTPSEVIARFGASGTADTAIEALLGGARIARIVRIGSGGSAASVVLQDTAATPVNVATIPAKYVGTRPNAGVESWSVTVRDSLTDASQRELVLYAGAAILEAIPFPKTSGDEAQGLVDAIAAADSLWLGPATKTTIGSGVLASVVNKPLAGGADPTAVTADYADALALIETAPFNMVVTDSELPAVHASVKAFVDRLVVSGIYPIGVVGEASTVALQTRLTNARALNDANLVYCGNGFDEADGSVHDGYRSVARIAGLISAAPYTDAITNLVVPSAARVHGDLNTSDLTQAKFSGMLTLRYNASGLPVVTQGITSLVTPAPNQDDGWKKIRRVRQRYDLINRVVLATDPLIGRIPNDDVGQQIVMGIIREVMGQMVAEGALRSDPPPTVQLDPALQPFAGPDESYFLMAFVDLDAMEYIYQTYGTSLVAPAAVAA